MRADGPVEPVTVLVLLRHGESVWNARDLFAGWTDVALSEHGRQQARRAGALLAARGLLPDVVHTSVQGRAIATADLALEACGRAWVPVRRSWRLNSNHYGALQGRGKQEVRAEAGEEQFMAWRRGFRVRPPLGVPEDDPRYATLPPDVRPRGESLHDVTERLLPYWCDAIVPDLYRYGCVLVASHGNTLRALVKYLEGVSDDASADLEVPNAVPMCYQFTSGHATRLAGLARHSGARSCRKALPVRPPTWLNERMSSAEPGDCAGTVVSGRGLVVHRGGHPVLDGLTFDLAGGKVTGLLGPSGCGKTTLMRVLVGVQAITAGTVTVLGLPAGHPRLRARVGYATQAPAVYTDLTLAENLRYFGTVLGLRGRRLAEATAATVARLDLGGLDRRLVGTFSGGQLARVGLAVALLGRPDLLILDEPTVGLDPVLRRDLWSLFHGLAADGASLLVSSHVMDEAARCDNLLFMREGRFLAEAPPAEILRRTGTRDLESAFLALAAPAAPAAQEVRP